MSNGPENNGLGNPHDADRDGMVHRNMSHDETVKPEEQGPSSTTGGIGGVNFSRLEEPKEESGYTRLTQNPPSSHPAGRLDFSKVVSGILVGEYV
jgi:hypothetical protein